MNALFHSSRSAFAALSACLVVAGCSTPHRFQVDAIGHPEARPVALAYHLAEGTVSAMPETVQAVARQCLENALADKGMRVAPKAADADVEIVLDFSVTGPFSVPKTRVEPVYVVTLGRVITGERVVAHNEKTYRKTLRLAARETPPRSSNHPRRELWSILVSNNDSSNDAEQYLRLMIAAAVNQLGVNRENAHTVVLTEGDGHEGLVEADGR